MQRRVITNVDKQVIDQKHPTIIRYVSDREYMDFKYSFNRVKVDGKTTFIPGHTGRRLKAKVKYIRGMTWDDVKSYECVPTDSIARNLKILFKNLDVVYDVIVGAGIASSMYLNSTWRTVQAVKHQARNSYHIFGGAADISFFSRSGKRIEGELNVIYDTILSHIKQGILPQGELFLYKTFIHYAPTNTKSTTSYTHEGDLVVGKYNGGIPMFNAFKYLES